VILISLIGIGVQDYKYFAISWGWIPVLIILGIIEGSSILPIDVLAQDYMMSLVFVVIQMVFMTIWFSIKEKRIVNLCKEILGLGDVLFLIVLVFYFSFINYLIFVIGSTILIALGYLIKGKISVSNENRIPLAGAMAFGLVILRLLIFIGIDINPYSNKYLWIV
jgi:hypothetical protein